MLHMCVHTRRVASNCIPNSPGELPKSCLFASVAGFVYSLDKELHFWVPGSYQEGCVFLSLIYFLLDPTCHNSPPALRWENFCINAAAAAAVSSFSKEVDADKDADVASSLAG